jgi:Fe2+ transport system protein FeoA
MPTLDQLRPGQTGRLVFVGGSAALVQRLAEMGFLAGALIRMVRTAPFGDPLEVDIDGCFLSLRKADARAIEIADG